MAKATSKAAPKKASGKRTTIAPRGDKRYVRRDEEGKFTESDDVGRSLSQDRKRSAKKEVKPGYGDQGDQKKRTTSKKGGATKAAAKKGGAAKATAKKSAAKKGSR